MRAVVHRNRVVPFLLGALALPVLAGTPGCGDAGAPEKSALAPTAEDIEPGETFRGTLEKETGVKWRVDVGVDGTIVLDPRSTPSPLSSSPANAQAAAERFLTDHAADLGLTKGSVHFVEHEVLEGGGHLYEFQQQHGGIDVPEGHVDVVLTEAGAIDHVIGRWVGPLDDVPTRAAVAPAAASSTAFADAKAGAAWLDASRLVGPKEARLLVELIARVPTLAYRVDVVASEEAGTGSLARRYVVDATTGQILAHYDLAEDVVAVPASGKGVREYRFGTVAPRSFTASTLDGSPGTYALVSPATDEQPEIRVLDGSADLPSAITSTDPNVWDEKPGSTENGAAVDAMFHLGLAARYFQSRHGRRSWDGKGAPVVAHVHAPPYSRAAWTPDDHVVEIGAAKGTALPASAGLDVLGHEYTHAIMTGFGYPLDDGQTGAIGEAMADVFGAIIEHEHHPDEDKNWSIGEDITDSGKPLRHVLHPHRGIHDAITHVALAKRGGNEVHEWSQIASHAFALMTSGGTHGDSRITIPVERAIGWPSLERLAYATIERTGHRHTSFTELAWRTVTLARRLRIPVEPVACAWVAVGAISRASALSEEGVECTCLSSTDAIVTTDDGSLACCDEETKGHPLTECCRKCDTAIEGHWQGDWGKISFARQGAELRAVYTYKAGTAIVAGEGDSYTACWSELPNRNAYPGIGPAQFKVLLDATGARIDGRWAHRGNPKWRDNWDLAWVSSTIPEEHKLRLERARDFATCR